MKQKAHASHELAYARMRREGQTSWNEAHGVRAEEKVPIDPETERFLESRSAYDFTNAPVLIDI